MAWYALKIILILQPLMEAQLNRIFIETADATDPALKLEHKFMELLLGLDEDVEALGTIQDAALHGIICFLLQDTASHPTEYRAP
jgi:hypothetical protein